MGHGTQARSAHDPFADAHSWHCGLHDPLGASLPPLSRVVRRSSRLPWPAGLDVGRRPQCAGSAGLDVKMAGMDLARARFLVDVLTPSGHLERIREFAGSLRQSTRRHGELLVVGTPGFEPWHFTAHMADEAVWARLPELEPTLVRWSVPPSAPTHLSVPLERLEVAKRGETLM